MSQAATSNPAASLKLREAVLDAVNLWCAGMNFRDCQWKPRR
jgi:hypothetical protein